MRRVDFMKMINESFPTGGLTCSFQDHQLSEFIQIKRRKAAQVPMKLAVQDVGPQDEDLWVLGPNVHINSQGESINPTESKYIWIGHLYKGLGVAPDTSACDITLPLTCQPLVDLMEMFKSIMKHNYFASVFTVAAFFQALHYNTIMKKYKNCQMPLIFGCPGTGKTTVAKCGLALTGTLLQRFWSQGTKEKYTQLCCSGCLPLLIDDPKSTQAISDLAIALFNGATEGTISRGQSKPSCMAVVTANFTVCEKEK